MRCRPSQSGFTCSPRTRPARLPKIGLRCDESTAESIERIAVGIEALYVLRTRAQAESEIWEQMFRWAMGDGPLPVDEEAEHAAMVWYSLWVEDEQSDTRLFDAFARVRELSTSGLYLVEVDLATSMMPWIEVCERLQWAAQKRIAVRATKAAMRALMLDQIEVSVRNLRGALDLLGAARGEALARVEDKGDDALYAWIRIQPEAIALSAEVRALREEVKALRAKAASLRAA